MHLDHKQSSAPLTKPQVHSHKYHHTYSATRQLPRALWIRSLRFGDADFNNKLDLTKECTLFYEIVLYYDHNRACTIYRTPDDFRMLKAGVGKLSRRHVGGGGDAADLQVLSWGQPPIVEDVDVLQQYLCEALRRKAKNCALEYFLRRRMEDCGGG